MALPRKGSGGAQPTSTRIPRGRPTPSPGPSRPLKREESKDGMKKPVAAPTSPTKFIVILILHACRKVLFLPVSVKVGIYTVGVLCGSLITDLFPLPPSYFSDKNNVFNSYFVVYGWGWTVALLSIFVYLTSYTYCCGNMKLVRRHLSRLLVATLAWYFWTSLFNVVEHVSGFCTNKDFRDKWTCFKKGFIWIGFDISGHAFLLIHCSLTIMEEMRAYQGWDKIAKVIRKEEDESQPTLLNSQELTELKLSYQDLSPYIKALVVWITSILLLWEVMLMCTTLYFHTMIQKVTGACIAVLTWFVSYQILFKIGGHWAPGLPGQGLFKYRHLK